MTKESDTMMDQFLKLDHPVVHKFLELQKEAVKQPTVDKALKFLADWKKDNPEEAAAMREFLCNFQDEYKESRRETKSKLGYSRVGLGNV